MAWPPGQDSYPRPQWKAKQVDCDEWTICFASDAQAAAELAAEEHCQWHAEWMSPLIIEVEGQGRFEVDIESVPVYTAKPISAKKYPVDT